MAFSKSFPRTGEKYPVWEEVELTKEEEKQQEELARKENIKILKQCLDDAKQIIQENNLKAYQSDIVKLAISLFEKQASHQIYWKENKAKDKFNHK
ncbi:MAG: hypothetical protein PHG05_01095 [Candidatus Nanoarchaeia archaeon]|nr:hypothetical protein [Candidatus Nanoarchaeia archaeon]